jgi:hypothetical protein
VESSIQNAQRSTLNAQRPTSNPQFLHALPVMGRASAATILLLTTRFSEVTATSQGSKTALAISPAQEKNR